MKAKIFLKILNCSCIVANHVRGRDRINASEISVEGQDVCLICLFCCIAGNVYPGQGQLGTEDHLGSRNCQEGSPAQHVIGGEAKEEIAAARYESALALLRGKER